MKKLILIAAALFALVATSHGQSPTAITYQGQLALGGLPANGYYDFKFSLHATSSGGGPVANTIAKPPIFVTNGLFATTLDFGAAGFPGDKRWLEIAVRPTGGTGNYETLAPRQRITATPYALEAATVADGAVTAAKLSPGAGPEGQVLKMTGGQLAWGTAGAGGGVSSVASGLGLTGGPITSTGTLAIDTAVVPRLNVANTFGNPGNSFVGSFAGNGAGLTNLSGVAATNYNGASITNLNASNIASGTLNDARLSANAALRNAHQTFTGSNTFTGVASLTNAANRFVGTFSGNGAGLTNLTGVAATNYNGASITNLNASNIASGTLNDARLSANVALRNAHQSFTGSNTFTGVASLTNTANRFVGTFSGDGGGLTNINTSFTNALVGDVTGLPGANTVARIRGVNVSATGPAANQLLRYNGSAWTPGAVALGTDVSGTLGVANGGTGAGTATAARTSLGAAASGANADITLLTGLTTPLSASQGGSGLSSFTTGDLLFANNASSLARLADVAPGNVLLSGGIGVAPLWGKVGLTTHVTGALPLANGGSGAATAPTARANLGAAASGANADITSLAGLTTPLAPTQGGSGQSAYSTGDLLFASAANTLARRAIGGAGQILAAQSGVPIWTNANAHNHFGQVWSGATVDGLYVQNTSSAEGASSFAGIVTGLTNLNYGVFGQTESSQGVGVQGLALAATGVAVGVSGESGSTEGIGVYGVATGISGTNAGVLGESSSPSGSGVSGQALATTGTPVGVYGYSAAATGYGFYTPNRLYVGNNAFVGGHLTMGTGSRIQADAGTTNLPGVTFFGNTSSGMFSPATNVLGFATAGNQRLRVAADGKIGVGRVATANRFEVEGEASKTTAGGWLANSDAAIKTEIYSVSGALNKLAQVRPVAFRYTPDYLRQHPDIEDKVYYNVIAQEFAQVFPDSVKASGERLNGRDILQVDTYPAIIYSIAAIQELRGAVQARDRELTELRNQNQKLEARLSAIEQRLAAGAR